MPPAPVVVYDGVAGVLLKSLFLSVAGRPGEAKLNFLLDDGRGVQRDRGTLTAAADTVAMAGVAASHAGRGGSPRGETNADVSAAIFGADVEKQKAKEKGDKRREIRLAQELKRQAKLLSEDVEFLHQCFTYLDADGDASLTREELRLWLTILNEGDVPTAEEEEDMLEKVGKREEMSQKGTAIDFKDFLIIVQVRARAAAASAAAAAAGFVS